MSFHASRFSLVIGFCLLAAAPGWYASVLAVDPQDAIDDGFNFPETDWPWWRGPWRNGKAAPDQDVPLRWDDSQNVVWKTPIPGRGHSSPIVVGDRIFLTTADESNDAQSVLCLARGSGEVIWNVVVHPQGGMRKNSKSSSASSSVACDGEMVYVNFANQGAVFTTALDLNGKKRWQTRVCDYAIHQGYAASPALYQSLVFVVADCKGGGAVAALRRDSGDIVWRRDRPDAPNYPSPIVQHVAGKDQLFLTGCDLVSSFDPMTGKTLWEIPGSTTECVTSTLTDGKLIFTSGGYPTNHLAGVAADGSGNIVWQHETRVYVPSLVLHEGNLYGVMDADIAACWDSATGEERWKARLGGTFSASAVLVKDQVFVTNEEGVTFIFRARPDQFESLGKNKLGTEVFATPTICGNRILMRVTEQVDGKRQEFLYCLANQP